MLQDEITVYSHNARFSWEADPESCHRDQYVKRIVFSILKPIRYEKNHEKYNVS